MCFAINLLVHVLLRLCIDRQLLLNFSERQISMHYNYDLTTIVTPINVDLLEQLLRRYRYDPIETDFLVKGFKSGFDIGYKGPENRKIPLETCL